MRRISIFMVVFITLLVSAGGVQAQACEPCLETGLREKVDAFVQQMIGELNIPGLALGIVRGDQIIHLQGYGLADLDGRPVTPRTPFVLASVSKSFTALATMQLVEAGKLSLDAPVRDYLPWFQPDTSETAITVRMLLHQTSGMTRYAGTEFDAGASIEANVRRLNTAPRGSQPGAEFHYSNGNFDVLGLLIEKVSGQDFDSYLRQHIFEPLDMSNAHTALSLDRARQDGLSNGYSPFLGRLMVNDFPVLPGMVASAGVIASAEDLAHYMIANLNDGRFGEAQVLSADGMTQLHESGVPVDGDSGYAMGWFLHAPTGDAPLAELSPRLEHDGWWSGFRSQVILLPGEQLGIVTLMNADDYTKTSAFEYPSRGVAYLLLGHELPPPQYFEDVLVHNARLAHALVIAFLLVRLVGAVRLLRRWNRQPESRPLGRVAQIRYLIVPLLIDLFLAALYGIIFPVVYEAPLLSIMRIDPENRLVWLIILVLTAGWGLMRTVLYVLALRLELTRTLSPDLQITPEENQLKEIRSAQNF